MDHARRWLSPAPELTRSRLGATLLGAYVLFYLSWQLFDWLPGGRENGQLLLIPMDVAALYAAWRASRRCAGSRQLRAFWITLTVAILAQTIADLVLAWNDAHYAAAPFPTLADPFFLAFYVLLFLSLQRVPVAPATRMRQLRTALDTALFVVGGGAAVWCFVIGPTVAAGGESALAKGVSLAYPIGDLILLAGLAAVLLRGSPASVRAPLLVIALGVLSAVVADVVYGNGVVRGTYTAGDPVDTLYLVEFAAFALAAGLQRPVVASDAPAPVEQFAHPAAVAGWLPNVGLAIGFGLVLVVEPDDAVFANASLPAILIVLAFLAGLRQFVAQRELLQLQRTLLQTERRFQAIFDNAGVGITYSQADPPTILDVNATFAAMVGRTSAELRGGDYSQIAAPQFAATDRALAATIARGEVDHLQQELRYVSADGSQRWAMLTISTVRDERGVPANVVGIFEDITRRRAAERMKDEFISVVGHELRTPLTSIRGSLGLLASGVVGALGEEADKLLVVAIANTDRLGRLVNDILDVERMDAGRLQLDAAPVTAAQLVEQSLQVVQRSADDGGVVLREQLEPLTVEADADRIVQTLVNLISNAIKFSPRDGRVTISARRDGANALFSVQDAGRGIPADQLERVFGRFNQVDASDARDKGGTGLGLAVARGIVEQHGGRIWAESGAGAAGSVFRFTLPLSGTATASASASAPPRTPVEAA